MKKFKLTIVYSCFAWWILSFATIVLAVDTPVISVSNKPLALVVKAVVGSTMTLNVIIPDQSDPHHFQLKPSDVLKVQRSDWLVWLGPSLEPNLAQLMVSKSDQHRITLESDFGLTLLHLRDTQHSHSHEADAAQQDHPHDPHVWLSPRRMIAFAQGLSARLQKELPHLAQTLQTNLTAFEQAAISLLDKTAVEFTSNPTVLFYHDAYQYLEREYDLPSAGYIVADTDQILSLRDMLKIKSRINAQQISCVLVEPGHKPKLLNKLFGDSNYRTEAIDFLGRDVQLTKNGYVNYILAIAQVYSRCR